MYNLITITNNEISIQEDVKNKIIEFEKAKKEIEYLEGVLKSELLEVMSKLDKNTIITDNLSFTYKKPSTRETVDTKVLKEEYPDIYKKCLKTSDVKPSIMIKIGD